MTDETAPHAPTEIEKRIAEGLIPPAPSYVHEHAKWSAWYDAHIRCATRDHTYFVRERDSSYCAQCIADGTAKLIAKAVESHMMIGVTNPPLTIPTTDGREVCCAGALHDASTHTDECTAAKRAAATPARRKPRAMP